MLSNECQRFLICIVLKNIEQMEKNIQSKEDAVKENMAKVIHKFEESIKNKKVT